MASGKHHFYYSLSVTALTIPLFFYDTSSWTQIVIGNVVGLLVTNDMDSAAITYNEQIISSLIAKFLILCGRSKGKAYKDVKIIHKIFAAITAPYGLVVVHRSFLSHFPIIGTATKTLYFYVIYYVLAKTFDIPIITLQILVPENLYSFGIWTLMDVLHYLMDGGYVIIFGKNRYTLGHTFYNLTRRLFPQGQKND